MNTQVQFWARYKNASLDKIMKIMQILQGLCVTCIKYSKCYKYIMYVIYYICDRPKAQQKDHLTIMNNAFLETANRAVGVQGRLEDKTGRLHREIWARNPTL